MWLPEILFVYSRIIRNAKAQIIKVMSKRGKNKKRQNYKKLQFDDLIFSDHSIERLYQDMSRRSQFNVERGNDIISVIKSQFGYFKTGTYNCRIQEVAVQATKYFDQKIMYNERLNLMMAVTGSNTVATVMSIKK